MTTRISRSGFATGTTATFATAGVCGRAAGAQFTYKVATLEPKDQPNDVGLQQVADAVRRETNGRLDMQLFPNSVLGGPDSLISQLRLGSIEFVGTGFGVFSAVAPVAQIFAVGYAFPSTRLALEAADGALGAYVRRELGLRGIYVFDKTFDVGYRQITTWPRAIRTVDDFAGLRVRSATSSISVDFWKTLGAAPTPVGAAEVYTALQTHVIDAQDNQLITCESLRVYEVQRFLSLTNHAWSGTWLAANTDKWKALPPDIQASVQRNLAKFAVAERGGVRAIEAAIVDKMKRRGLVVVEKPNLQSMRTRLVPYYAKWKNELGSTAWSLLEGAVGSVG